MKISGAKTKLLSTVQDEISISNQNIENVNSFVYFGSVIPDTQMMLHGEQLLQHKPLGDLKKKVV